MSSFWPSESESESGLSLSYLLVRIARAFMRLLDRLKETCPEHIARRYSRLVPNLELILILWRIEEDDTTGEQMLDVYSEATTDRPHDERLVIDHVRCELIQRTDADVGVGPLNNPIHLN